ncbi:hypothetical protein ABZ916_31925 [Streptomyces sp. NPDC046853]|uniref:hypothetical protein n=1 Tax=Streptomyces sp. NPDC046853 TaxID=3154920 RepID=UPI0033F7C95F
MAPVILLVAVVEVHQIARRTGDRSAAMAAAYQNAIARLSTRASTAPPQELQEISNDVSRLERQLDGRFERLDRLLYYIWGFTGTLLLVSLSTCLHWLADDTREADTISATFHLVALNWGAFVVVNAPLVTWIVLGRRMYMSAETYRDAMIQAARDSRGGSPGE